MTDQIDQIRQKIDIVSLISEYFPLKKAGRNFKALCPFHAEKTPSFIVSPERQIWYCFGACQDGGDIFKFLMRRENLEFGEALRILAQKTGVVLKDFKPSATQKLKEKIYEINHLASEFYHYLLTQHPAGKKALFYLKNRGISEKSVSLFKLGYAPNLWDGLVKFLGQKKGYSLEDLGKAGLVIDASAGQKNYYDRFRQRIIFTLKDWRGNILGFAGRILDPQVKEAKYINTPETPVYTKGDLLYGLDLTREAIKKESQAIVVEGEFDLIQSFQAGVQNVVATKGSALTEGQLNLLKRFTENLALAFDPDLAGEAASRRAIELAEAAGLNMRIIQMGHGKDPDECIRENPSFWFRAVKKAIPLYDFLIDSAFLRHFGKAPERKKKIGEEVLPFLGRIQNEIVKAHYLRKLAQKLEVGEEVLRLQLLKMGKPQTLAETQGPKVKKTISSREEILEEYLLSLFLQGVFALNFALTPIFTEFPPKKISFAHPALKRIFNFLLEFLAKEKERKIAVFGKNLPPELIPSADRLYLLDLGEMGEEKFLREIQKTLRELQKLTLRKKLKKLAEKMKKKPPKELPRLNQEFQKLRNQYLILLKLEKSPSFK